MKRTYFFLGGLAALALLVIGVTAASAANNHLRQGGDLTEEERAERQEMREEHKVQKEAHRAEMESLLEVGDYNAWKEAVEAHQAEREANRPCGDDCPEMPNVLDKITEDNFAKFVEMHNLMKNGDKEGAKAIADELGLEKFGSKKMMRKGMRKFMRNHEFKDNNGDGVCDRLDIENDN